MHSLTHDLINGSTGLLKCGILPPGRGVHVSNLFGLAPAVTDMEDISLKLLMIYFLILLIIKVKVRIKVTVYPEGAPKVSSIFS